MKTYNKNRIKAMTTNGKAITPIGKAMKTKGKAMNISETIGRAKEKQ